MQKDSELLRQNYLTHKAKKEKQWAKKRRKAATKKKNLENIVHCHDCNCIPCYCQSETY